MFPLKDTIPSYTKPVLTVSIIVANVIVFFYELSLDPRELLAFLYNYGFVPGRYTLEQLKGAAVFQSNPLVPLFSSMFLHGGWTHLIGNMWSLWLFGDNVEDVMGKFNFLMFYICSGLVAMGMHFLANIHSTVPTIGASGAISGIMGAYFVFFPYSRIITLFIIFLFPLLVEIPAVFYLGMWFLSQLFNGTLSIVASPFSGVAWWAHIGGFVFGILAGGFFVRRSPRRYRI
ncbi:MAG: rhomboid family intramembrane serine protease [Thermotogae bacterium]|nr:rhomboid family intramembrane serine protease [Thermotogota bacterium]RKX45895.1 MAG: rhomboid family intramembrane serine protease [Thermotogota bacterium]